MQIQPNESSKQNSLHCHERTSDFHFGLLDREARVMGTQKLCVSEEPPPPPPPLVICLFKTQIWVEKMVMLLWHPNLFTKEFQKRIIGT